MIEASKADQALRCYGANHIYRGLLFIIWVPLKTVYFSVESFMSFEFGCEKARREVKDS